MVAATTACHANFVLVPLLLFILYCVIFSSLVPLLEVPKTTFERVWAVLQKALLILDVSMDGAVALLGLAFILSSWLLQQDTTKYRNPGPSFGTGVHDTTMISVCYVVLHRACSLAMSVIACSSFHLFN